MNEDLRVVFESRNRQSCADRALVLASLEIPHQLVDDGGSCAVIVPASFSARAPSYSAPLLTTGFLFALGDRRIRQALTLIHSEPGLDTPNELRREWNAHCVDGPIA